MKNFVPRRLMIELKPSKMIKDEIGLFAARNLERHTIIAQAEKMDENFVPWKEYDKVDKRTQIKIQQFCLQTEDGFFAPNDLNYLSVPWYMNHSCTYNVGFDKKGNFITVRKIKEGEELVIDYGLAISNSDFKLDCKCKSKNCRKKITGSDWKNKKFVMANEAYMLRELLRQKNKKNKS